jgi:hypothetical protein
MMLTLYLDVSKSDQRDTGIDYIHAHLQHAVSCEGLVG